MFPRIPGGCKHQESAGNRVLDKCYRRCCDIICFYFVFEIWIVPNHPKIVSKINNSGETCKLVLNSKLNYFEL